MDLSSIAIAVLGAVAGPAASIKVAAISAGRTLADLEKKLDELRLRILALEETEPAQVARLREDVDRIAKELGTVHSLVDVLTDRINKAEIAEEKRRDQAAARAERREERERTEDRSLTAKIAELTTLVRTLMEELRDVRAKLR